MVKTGIYKITNTKTNMFYIGSSYNIPRRWREHRNRLNSDTHDNQHLQNAWNKYGETNFKFEIIELVKDRDKLIEREQDWIDKTQCYKRDVGYNIAQFADTNLRRLSEKTIKKIADLYKQGVHYKKIAETTRVSVATVHDIKNGHIYNEITGFEKIEYKPNKLNVKEVKYIARICKNAIKRGIEIRSIAERLSKELGISESTIYDINKGRSWDEVTGIKYEKEYERKTENDIKKIYNDIKNGKQLDYICKKYDVTERYINRILRGEIWSNVTGIEYKRNRLTEEQVKEIYIRKHKGEKTSVLVEEFDVTPQTINRIKNRRIWKDVTKDIAI